MHARLDEVISRLAQRLGRCGMIVLPPRSVEIRKIERIISHNSKFVNMGNMVPSITPPRVSYDPIGISGPVCWASDEDTAN